MKHDTELVRLAEPVEHYGNPMRGILIGLALSAPVWAFAIWLWLS